MARKHFYHATTRKLVTIFGALFKDIEIELDETKELYKVPIHFATREKFLTMLAEIPDAYSSVNQRNVVMLAFELTGMNYAPERATNNTQKIRTDKEDSHLLNRVPYDLNFNVYISAKQLEQSFKIVEQIIPMFKPAFNVTINELKGKNFRNDISISLDSITPEIDAFDVMQKQREISWTLQFTVKGWYYPIIERSTVIKEAIINLMENDDASEELFMTFTSEVIPRSASRHDKHEVKDTVTDFTTGQKNP